ncbi:MAG: glycosyltransferase family 39 protein [Candidatus Palauibacterales bacterium]|nr:glycosyltransferase family 39 protein [Candidatus Palauibacterales bacterium]MDP2583956.1 glycosyltransferase family 39 protein [Candidatus Palauibacterales bacterium]
MRRPEGGAGRARSRWLFVGGFIVAALVTLPTLHDYGVASDVPNYFTGALLELRWFGSFLHGLVTGSPGEWLRRGVVFDAWRWWRERLPHPPLSRELGGLGYFLLRGVLHPLTAYRVATALVYAGLVGAVGVLVRRRSGSATAGVAAAASVLAIPPLFAYGHLALTDMMLAAFWFGAVAALDTYLEGGRDAWLWLAGLSLGAAVATKFTALLLPPVLAFQLLVWVRGRDGRPSIPWREIGVLALCAVLVFAACNPVMWVDPARGLGDFLAAGFHRAEDPHAQITTFYLGRMYEYRPPRSYPFVWTLVVIPIPLLIGLGAGLLRWRSGLVRLSLPTLVVVYGALMLPAAPLHDGIRLLLPAFPFLCVIIGVGCGALADRLADLAGRRWPGRVDLARVLVMVALFAVPILDVVAFHPFELSYFNGLVGGIRGAESRGLEISNLKEVLTPKVLVDLAHSIPPGSVIDPDFFLEEVCFDRELGLAPADWVVEMEDPGAPGPGARALVCAPGERQDVAVVLRPPRRPDFVFILNRRGIQSFRDRALVRSGGRPYFEVTVHGVPLLQVFRTSR